MSKLTYLGAINKLTDKYVYPKIANKKDEYICPECNKDLILVQGDIRVHHFRHKVDSINPCHYYSKPTESQIHKDAKKLMKTLLENRTHIKFIRGCISCKTNTEINIPEITDDSIITLEYRFNYENVLRIADIAHTIKDEIKGIYEICNTHKTSSESRPEPWVEIDANRLLTVVNTSNINTDNKNTSNEPLIIKCIRCERCKECNMKNLKITNLTKYVRIKLGQDFENPMYDEDDRPSHDRLHFHDEYYCGDDPYEDNKKICNIFNNDNDLGLYRIVLYVHEGSLAGYLISKKDYNKYDYWNVKYRSDGYSEELKIPYEYINCYGGGGCGTVATLEDLIRKSDAIQNKYKFITQQVSIFPLNFPDTTKIIYICRNRCKITISDITICNEITVYGDIIVDCENNFSKDEKKEIDKFNINNIEELIRNDKISKNDKQRCLKCFDYVRKRYELMGIEPSNGHNLIKLEKYAISIRILPDGIIKYCKSFGEKNSENFTIFEMV